MTPEIEARLKRHYWGIRAIEDAYPKLKTSILALKYLGLKDDPDIEQEDVNDIALMLSDVEEVVLKAMSGKCEPKRKSREDQPTDQPPDAPRPAKNATDSR